MSNTLTRRSSKYQILPSIFSMERSRHYDTSSIICCQTGLPTMNNGIVGEFSSLLDLRETNENDEVHADLPGLNPDEVKVQVADNILTISGERNFDRSNAEGPDSER